MAPSDLADMLRAGDTVAARGWLHGTNDLDVTHELSLLDRADTAIAFRLLERDRALNVFEALEPHDQQLVLDGLRDDRVLALVEAMDPDDRARLLDEMPAGVATRLLAQLSPNERASTALLLGYPEGSAGRIMSPEYVSLRAAMTVAEAMERIRRMGVDAETIYALPVVDDQRRLIGITGLRTLVLSAPDVPVASLMTTDVHTVVTHTDQEVAARLVTDAGLIALPVVDSQQRLVGVITVDDAMRIIEAEETEDFAIHGASTPLGRPYLAVSVLGLARARAVWLLVLIIAAALTVNVLDTFEDTLSSAVTLALFVPLLIGTGGNVGAQAATAVIRAIALDEVRFADLPRILWREARTGVLLGLMLAAAGAVPVWIFFDGSMAVVVTGTLIVLCTWASAVGACLPVAAKRAGVDPAVVSAPLITTLVDASGLLIYFLIAQAVLDL